MPTVPLPPPMPEPGTPDEAVVDRVLGGDVQAFELLMRRNNARLYRAIRSLVHEEEAVEELMQQSYVLAYTRLQQFARGARFSTWLLRIGLNEALQRLRRERRWPRVAPDVLDEEPAMPSNDPSPEQRLSRAKATLRDALERYTGESMADLYPFEAPRCDRVVAGVLARLEQS